MQWLEQIDLGTGGEKPKSTEKEREGKNGGETTEITLLKLKANEKAKELRRA